MAVPLLGAGCTSESASSSTAWEENSNRMADALASFVTADASKLQPFSEISWETSATTPGRSLLKARDKNFYGMVFLRSESAQTNRWRSSCCQRLMEFAGMV
jgi:hypothetical protein